MSKLIFVVAVILALAACVSANSLFVGPLLHPEADAQDAKVIDAVNAHPTATWKAQHNSFFSGKKVREVRTLLGAKGVRVRAQPSAAAKAAVAAPTSFDWRTESKCVHPIRDQGHCGSCWAFAASEVLSDRFCLASKGSVDLVLSPEYMVDCDKSDYGCNGGYLDRSWNFLKNTGIPTDACYPYVAGGGVASKCNKTCQDGSPLKLYKTKNIVEMSSESEVEADLVKNGPVETGFMVYQDFISYKTGVYHHVSGGLLGGHAVKIVGYGVESGTKYWIVANSWAESWGEKGFFRIKKGSNECGFESNVIAGEAAL